MSLAATPAKHKVLCIVSLHVLVLALVRGDGPVSCAGGWALIGDRCFHYSAEERNYDDSVAYCHSLGSVIASIHSETENEAVTGLIPTGDGRSAYIGAESNGARVWSWYDGTEWWQPAVHGGLDGVSEIRVVINDKARDDRKWHDWQTGDVPHGVLCAASIRSIVTAIPPTACSPFCWSGWSLIEERCFLYSDQERSYNDSVTYCRLLGSVIASIHSETENAAVTAMIPVGVGKSAYIGAESNGEGVWSWHDGTEWWQPLVHAGLDGWSETRVVINDKARDDQKWHDWQTGEDLHGVLCAASLQTVVYSPSLCPAESTPAPASSSAAAAALGPAAAAAILSLQLAL
ncbi:unnamed protein product [Symbiodinium natans]|uniref:C-type lectin domain-containing protein n=1 Tax=Symbiodinium natans TaxID=878477 RepID=A0A812UQZ6_9DINO|nr:unnamed protein product [Symbiodinium natans]